jgi:hypothetical protein
MYQRDYLLRMIQMLAQVIARVLGQKDRKSIEEALLEIDRAGKMYVGLDSGMISSFSDEDLITLFHTGGSFDTTKCLALAELQYAEAQILELHHDDPDCRRKYQRSLHFFLAAVTEDRDISVQLYNDKIDDLLKKLDDCILPPNILKKLFLHYEQQGTYAKAEDILFELLETHQMEIKNDGIAFYKRLLCKKDDDLRKGNLPRNEVEDGLNELIERTAS